MPELFVAEFFEIFAAEALSLSVKSQFSPVTIRNRETPQDRVRAETAW
jgi:hypothetical protein